MRIADITIDDIRGGKNWRALVEDFDFVQAPLEELEIENCLEFCEDDVVVYSAIYVVDDDKVNAMVLIKEAFDVEYGGDYCVFEKGKWQQLGLKPNPSAIPGSEYIASPLEADASFDAPDHDFRKWNRKHFNRYVILL